MRDFTKQSYGKRPKPSAPARRENSNYMLDDEQFPDTQFTRESRQWAPSQQQQHHISNRMNTKPTNQMNSRQEFHSRQDYPAKQAQPQTIQTRQGRVQKSFQEQAENNSRIEMT